MSVFEVEGQDGKIYEVDAPDLATAARAVKSMTTAGGVSTDSQAVSEFEGKAAALMDGAQNGASFGFGDNIAGVRAAMGQGQDAEGNMQYDFSGTAGERYRKGRDLRREQYAETATAEPGLNAAGNIGGAMVPAAMTLPIATGANLFQTALRGAGIGATEGALAGAGNADGVDVAQSAGKGGLLGAFLGGAVPVGVAGANRIRQGVADPITGLFDMALNRANQTKANRAIAGTLKRSGKSGDEVSQEILRAAQDGQGMYTLMDATGIAGQRAANGVGRAGGDAGVEISEFLARRQADQGDRIASNVDEAFGLNGKTADDLRTDMTAARKSNADDAYDAARGNAAPVDVRGALAVIDERIGGMKGSNVQGDSIDSKLTGYRNRLAAKNPPNGETARELSDFDRVLGVKQSLQDDIGAAVRAGRNNEARELTKLVQQLDAALEDASPSYRAANDGFAKASGEIDAIDKGAQMARPSQRAQDNVGRFGAMTPEQQAAARAGYGNDLLAKLEAVTSPTSNRAKPLQSTKRDMEAGAMSVDPDLYGRRLSRENEMWSTQNRVNGGSQTTSNQVDVDALNNLSGGVMDAVEDVGNFQFGKLVRRGAEALRPAATGQTDATRQLIARALMSKDPMAIIGPALRQEMTGQKQMRLFEMLLRGGGNASANSQ